MKLYQLDSSLIRVDTARHPDYGAPAHTFHHEDGWLAFYDHARAFADGIELTEADAVKLIQDRVRAAAGVELTAQEAVTQVAATPSDPDAE